MQDVAIRTVALTLLHFLWQGTLIGGFAAITLRGRIARTAKRRYLICLLALLACGLAPILTALFIFANATGQGARPTDAPTGAAALHPPQLAELLSHDTVRLVSLHTSDLMSGGVLLWLVGALSMAAYYVVQWRGVDAVRRSSFPLRAPAHLLSCAEALLGQWKATIRVSVMLSHAVTTPIVIGLWRPMIIFPAATIARMPVSDFELILLHEMAHIIRRDALANVLQVMLEILLFYHPVIHWLSRRARAERECACDEFVVTASGSAYRYAQALTALALNSARGAPLELAATGGDLLLRLKNLAGEESEGEAFPRGRVQLLMLGLLLLFSLWAYAPPGGTWWGSGLGTGLAGRKAASAGPLEPVAKAATAAPTNELPDSAPLLNIETPYSSDDAARVRRARVTQSNRTPAAAVESRLDEITTIQSPEPGAAIAGDDSNREPPAALTVQAPTNAEVAPDQPAGRVTDDEASAAHVGAPIPIYSPMPEYPVRARVDGIQGYVVATLRVGPDGRPTGLRVTEATPVGVFEGAVRRSLMRWRYDVPAPTLSAPERAVSYRLNFSLDGVSSASTSVCATATASLTCEPQ